MMVLDGQPAKISKCENCTFKGVLRLKTMVRPQDLDSITGTVSNEAPTLWVCVTCFDTPIGCVSENVRRE